MHYIVGDIHANRDAFDNLLRVLSPQTGDAFIFLGDYIDKNPHTREILSLLDALQTEYPCVFLKGNHEFVWDRYLNFGELERQEFLLSYGGREALEQYDGTIRTALEKNELPLLRKALQPYLRIISTAKDWHIVGSYLALHAGLLREQYSQLPLVFREQNYFVRPQDFLFQSLYLDRYALVAGHTYLGDEPTVKQGYINIDLGAGYGKYLGAF